MKINGLDAKIASASALCAVIAAEESLPHPSPDRLRDLRERYRGLEIDITAEIVRQHRARIGLVR